jgi:hypothetical protein
VCARREIFGVAHERDAGVGDHALMHGGSDDRGKLAGRGAVGRAVEEIEDVTGVGGVEVAGNAGHRERVVLNKEGADFVRLVRARDGRISRWYVVSQLNAQAEAFRALGEEVPVGKTHELAGELADRNRKAELRPDASRLAGGEGYAGKGRTQSLFST